MTGSDPARRLSELEEGDNNMHIKNTELKIDPNDPFKTDQLGRLESAEALTELIASLDEPFVLNKDEIELGGGIEKIISAAKKLYPDKVETFVSA